MGCGASAPASTIQNVDAPHLTEYFKALEEYTKTGKDPMTDMKQVMAAAADPAKMKQLEEKQQAAEKQLHIKLTPIIEKAFDHHDKNQNGTLDPDESKVFFDNYVKLQSQFSNAIQAHTKAQGTKMAIKQMPAAKTALKQKEDEFNKDIEQMMQACGAEYKGNEEKYNKAAFEAMDVNKDGQLVKDVCVKSLLLNTPENKKFQDAFPTGPTGFQKMFMAKIEAQMAALGM
jgi:Ca2+-binding EF-hand superfamily protein